MKLVGVEGVGVVAMMVETDRNAAAMTDDEETILHLQVVYAGPALIRASARSGNW